MRARTIFAVLALMFAGPALADAPATDKPDPNKTIPRSIFAIDDLGNATHLQSQWQCPATFGDYRRDELHIYDAFGLDVSCDYRLGLQDAIVTLYLTKRSGGDLKADFEIDKAAIVKRVPDATALADAEQKTFPSDRDWMHMIYAVHGGEGRDGVWLAWYGDWEYEIRVSWSAQLTDQVLATLAQMTDSAKSVSAHLARCAQSQVPLRDGKMVTDTDTLTQLSLMANIELAAAGLPDEKTGKVPPDLSIHPDEWCAEGSVPDSDQPVLLWHGLKADGTSLAADRASLMTYGDPPVLEIVAEPTLNFILSLDKSDSSGPIIFVASMTQGDQTTIYGFFEGRPDGPTLAKILSGYQNGTARAFSGYNKKSKQIQIVTPPEKK